MNPSQIREALRYGTERDYELGVELTKLIYKPVIRIHRVTVEQMAILEPALVETLREAFKADIVAPVRHHHTLKQPGADATLLLMPAWTTGEQGGEQFLGTKIVTVFPDNGKISKPAVLGSYILMSANTGLPLAAIDGRMLTLRRTAAASALAARFLARPDSARLLMVGTGALAPQLVLAHASMRPIREVLVWGRAADKAQRLAAVLDSRRMSVRATTDLASWHFSSTTALP